MEITGEARMPTGRLTITASVTLGRSILPPIVMGFLNAHSRVTAKVLLLDRVVNLVEEGIDVAVRIGAAARLDADLPPSWRSQTDARRKPWLSRQARHPESGG